MFNAKHEDVRTGRVWQGVIKYVMGALVEMSDAPPEHKLLVCLRQIPNKCDSEPFTLQGETPLQVLDSVECSDSTKMMEVFSAVGSVKTFFCIHRGDIKVSSRY